MSSGALRFPGPALSCWSFRRNARPRFGAFGVRFADSADPKVHLSPAQYRTLIRCGDRKIDMVQLANNHILDEGRQGIRITVAQLEKDGIAYCGLNRSEIQSQCATIAEIGGFRTG